MHFVVKKKMPADQDLKKKTSAVIRALSVGMRRLNKSFLLTEVTVVTMSRGPGESLEEFVYRPKLNHKEKHYQPHATTKQNSSKQFYYFVSIHLINNNL